MYIFIESRQHKRGGEIATLFHDSLECKQLFFGGGGELDSLGCLVLQLKCSTRAPLMNVYRLPQPRSCQRPRRQRD